MAARAELETFWERLSLKEVPPEVVRQAKRVLLDTLGCILAGSRTPAGQQMALLAREDPSLLMDALVGGTLANALDLDDGHRTAKGHPAGVIVPAALAALRLRPTSGAVLLEAVVAGYEIGLRAGLAINADTYLGSAHWGAFGAAAAAARVLGLGPQELTTALGICEVIAPTCRLMGWVETRQIPGIKEGMGWGAATGAVAAMMARRGMTGTLTIFDGKEAAARLDRLGTEFEILRLYFKRYPSCRWTHSALDNFAQLLREHGIAGGEVSRVRVELFENGRMLDNRAPATVEQAQYSTPFLLAAMALDGEVGVEQFIRRRFEDPDVREWAGRVVMATDPALDALFPAKALARVTIETAKGQVVTKENRVTEGDWDDPLSDAEMQDKFLALAAPVLGLPKAEGLARTIAELEKLPDAGALLPFLGAPGA